MKNHLATRLAAFTQAMRLRRIGQSDLLADEHTQLPRIDPRAGRSGPQALAEPTGAKAVSTVISSAHLRQHGKNEGLQVAGAGGAAAICPSVTAMVKASR